MRWPMSRRAGDRGVGDSAGEPVADPVDAERRIRWSRVIAYGLLPGWRCCWPRRGLSEMAGRFGPRRPGCPRGIRAGRHRRHHRAAVLPARHRREGPRGGAEQTDRHVPGRLYVS